MILDAITYLFSLRALSLLSNLYTQVKPLLQMTRQEEEMIQKEEELQKARDLAHRIEAELTEITLKHTQVWGLSSQACLRDGVGGW